MTSVWLPTSRLQSDRRYSEYVIELDLDEAPEGSKGAVSVGQSWHPSRRRSLTATGGALPDPGPRSRAWHEGS